MADRLLTVAQRIWPDLAEETARTQTALHFLFFVLVMVSIYIKGRPAGVIENKIISAIFDFMGDAPQHDDITLMVVCRDKS